MNKTLIVALGLVVSAGLARAQEREVTGRLEAHGAGLWLASGGGRAPLVAAPAELAALAGREVTLRVAPRWVRDASRPARRAGNAVEEQGRVVLDVRRVVQPVWFEGPVRAGAVWATGPAAPLLDELRGQDVVVRGWRGRDGLVALGVRATTTRRTARRAGPWWLSFPARVHAAGATVWVDARSRVPRDALDFRAETPGLAGALSR